jgi:hypothetical protein
MLATAAAAAAGCKRKFDIAKYVSWVNKEVRVAEARRLLQQHAACMYMRLGTVYAVCLTSCMHRALLGA